MAGKTVAANSSAGDLVLIFAADGEVAEWPNVPDSKSGVGVSLPRVRIPPSPPGMRSKPMSKWAFFLSRW